MISEFSKNYFANNTNNTNNSSINNNRVATTNNTNKEVPTTNITSVNTNKSSDMATTVSTTNNAVITDKVSIPLNHDGSLKLEYEGCFRDTEERSIPWKNEWTTFEECKQKAIQNKSQYFAMQAHRGNATGACMYGDPSLVFDQVKKYGISTDCTKYLNDRKFYGGSWTNAVYSITNNNNKNYEGCYRDTENRAIPWKNEWITFEQCRQKAIQNKSPYFAMQAHNGKGIAGCMYGDKTLTFDQVKKHGNAPECIKNPNDGNFYGGNWTNAVYSTY